MHLSNFLLFRFIKLSLLKKHHIYKKKWQFFLSTGNLKIKNRKHHQSGNTLTMISFI
jgi:hypothetical protein